MTVTVIFFVLVPAEFVDVHTYTEISFLKTAFADKKTSSVFDRGIDQEDSLSIEGNLHVGRPGLTVVLNPLQINSIFVSSNSRMSI